MYILTGPIEIFAFKYGFILRAGLLSDLLLHFGMEYIFNVRRQDTIWFSEGILLLTTYMYY